MSRHDHIDDGAQAKGKFNVMDTPMNVTTEGGAAPSGDNLVPTAEFPDPLGLMPKKGGSPIGPKG